MEIIEMLENYKEYVEILENGTVYVKDCLGFSDTWDEILQDLPEELYMILDDLKKLGYKVKWSSMDI